MTYELNKIEEAKNFDVAVKMLEQGEKAVRVILNDTSYILTKEVNYTPVDDGSSLIR